MTLKTMRHQLKALQSLHAIDSLAFDQSCRELALAQDTAEEHAQRLSSIREQCSAILSEQQHSQKAGARVMLGHMTLLSRQYQGASELMAQRGQVHDEAVRHCLEREVEVRKRQAALDALNERCQAQKQACARERDRLEALMLEDLWVGRRFMEEQDRASA